MSLDLLKFLWAIVFFSGNSQRIVFLFISLRKEITWLIKWVLILIYQRRSWHEGMRVCSSEGLLLSAHAGLLPVYSHIKRGSVSSSLEPPILFFFLVIPWSLWDLSSPTKDQTRVLNSEPTTSWEIDGETVETVVDFIFLGSKITADGDCSHEIKRHLLLGRKVMTWGPSTHQQGLASMASPRLSRVS